MKKTYLKNSGDLYYPLVKYLKAEDTAVLIDPHTQEEFTLKAVSLCLKLGNYRVIKK